MHVKNIPLAVEEDIVERMASDANDHELRLGRGSPAWVKTVTTRSNSPANSTMTRSHRSGPPRLNMDKRFENLEGRFDRLQLRVMGGLFAIVAALIAAPHL